MPRAASQLSLKGRALKYLSAREHSRAELARKLAPYTEDSNEIEPLLDLLQQRGFLSDARFVESVIHRRAPRMGAARVKQELQLKGIAPEHIRSAVQNLQATELERAQAVWQQRFGQLAADAREQARQVRFLLSRGFAGEVVRKVIKGSGLEEDN